jgi:SAM-dependent methyltransferase
MGSMTDDGPGIHRIMNYAAQQRWNQRYLKKPLVWSAEPNALFADAVSQLEPGRALDAGCGEGRNAIWLAQHGWDVTAVDFSSAGVAKGRQISAQQNVAVRWRVEDVAAIEVALFDLVAVLYLHTDAVERDRWLPHVIDCVAPHGYFVYVGHDPLNITEGVGGPQDAGALPSVEEITRHLRGFTVVSAEIVPRRVVDDPGHGGKQGTALDTFVMARKNQ